MPNYRKIFPSYDWDDVWLVNQIVNQKAMKTTPFFQKGSTSAPETATLIPPYSKGQEVGHDAL